MSVLDRAGGAFLTRTDDGLAVATLPLDFACLPNTRQGLAFALDCQDRQQ